MRLDRAAAEIRPRRWWEAVDLGFAMVRAWWRPLWGIWLATFLPVALLATIASRFAPAWAWLIVWWLKPAYDAALLHVLSRALFGEATTVGGTLSSLPTVLRRVGPAFLTWRRLSPGRAFVMPVLQLEGLPGGALRARLRVLARGGYGEAVRLLVVCQCFEIAIALSLAGLAVLLHPDPDLERWVEDWAAGGFGAPAWLAWTSTLAAFAAMTAVEPFYVAGGFALYLNRRTRLEAWDIELSFRRLSRRLVPPAAVVLACVLGAAVLHAADRAAPPSPDPARVVRDVLDDPAFATKRTVRGWRFKSSGNGAPWRPDLTLSRGLGAIVEPFVWIATLGALGTVAWLIARETRLRRTPVRTVAPPPETVFGLDIRPESLPDDPAGRARDLWALGRATEALGLLYRAALARLAAEGEVELRASATEGDCVRLVAAVAPPTRAAFFRGLTEAWQAAAYGHRVPAREGGDALVDGWLEHFGRRA